ncbi:hypothetical protein ACEPAH_1709 [Sanghuangporus vaninii]
MTVLKHLGKQELTVPIYLHFAYIDLDKSNVIRDQHGSDAANSAKTEQNESSTYERDRPRPQSLFERPSRHDDHTAAMGRLLPTSPTYPYFDRRSSSSTRSDQKASTLPLALAFDPLQQLARVNNLLSLHQNSFFNGPLAATGPVMAEGLMNVTRILREHELDRRLEDFRRGVEHDDKGMTFSEKLVRGQGNADQGSDWRSPMYLIDTGEADYHVFGQPLCVTRSYASCVSSVAGYQHDLPIVVNACVEELYRTGMTESGLFRSPPDAARHKQLIELFDNGPFFGRSETLTKERTEDICALLRSYIDRLPHPLWHESLFDPMLRLCVSSTVFGDWPLSEGSENKDRNVGLGTGYKITQTRPTSLFVHGTPSTTNVDHLHARSSSLGDITAFAICRPSSALSTVAHNEINISKERPQVSLAKAFFRLLPRMHLAVLAYLCAFFSQLPLCSHNQLTIEDIARFFAVPLFLGKLSEGVLMPSEAYTKRKQEARMIMVWILRRWSQISEGLFDAEDTDSSDGSEDELVSPSSSDDPESVQTIASDRVRPANENDSGVDPKVESPTIGPLPEGQSTVKDNADLVERKNHVEQDIAELRRTLLKVRARLETHD